MPSDVKSSRPAPVGDSEGERKRPRTVSDLESAGASDGNGVANAHGADPVRLAPGYVNEYSGFEIPAADYSIERIDVGDVTPEQFFRDYVATRKPVVLSGFLTDSEFTAPAKWTNEYLDRVAGDETLAVERRGDTSEKFGRGIEVQMKFRELLALLAGGDELHYLTTQDVEAEADGRPEVMAPFVACLQQDFPLRPALLGHLVPQNINIWMGNNRHGSSTGLHHDYHDNLYILLRGRKRFRLYSPADTDAMYTRGQLTRVHANGRINYEGEETTAYGADPFAEAAALAAIEKENAERELELAELAAERGEEGAAERVAKAEERLDAAMLAVLRADNDEVADDADEPENEEAFHFEEEDEGDDFSEEDDPEELDELALDPEEVDVANRKKVDQTIKDPVSFSRIDTTKLANPESKEELFREFPRFRGAKVAFCELEVGDMLFLPASWFHEVESFGSENGHLALNYWYHPPDCFESFEKPYSSPFWPRDWEMRFAKADSQSTQ